MENKPAVQDKQKKELPSLIDLFESNIEIVGKAEIVNAYLNQDPPKDWIKKHPVIDNWLYIPIEKVEMMLSKFFKIHEIQVLKTGMLLNSVEVNVRVNYLHPANNQMMKHDGVGAWEIQTQKGSGALKMDMTNINRGAVAMALGIAKSIAIKDACDHLGRIFGRDLNRKDLSIYNPDENLFSNIKSNKDKLKDAGQG